MGNIIFDRKRKIKIKQKLKKKKKKKILREYSGYLLCENLGGCLISRTTSVYCSPVAVSIRITCISFLKTRKIEYLPSCLRFYPLTGPQPFNLSVLSSFASIGVGQSV